MTTDNATAWDLAEDPMILLNEFSDSKDLIQGKLNAPSDRKCKLLEAALNSDLCGDERYCMGWFTDTPLAKCQAEAINVTRRYRKIAADLVREILGNPYRQLKFAERPIPQGTNWIEEMGRWWDKEHIRAILNMENNTVRYEVVPDWLTPEALAIAKAIYDDSDWQLLPILADRLEDSDCDVPEIIEHLRSSGPHVRGCFCLDKLLGYS